MKRTMGKVCNSVLFFVLWMLRIVTGGQTEHRCSISFDDLFGGLFVDCSHRDLRPDDLANLSINCNATTTLVLSYNNGIGFPSDFIAHFTHLKRLECTQCGIRQLGIKALTGLDSLEILALDNNHLRLKYNAIPKGVFQSTPKLKRLNIASNDNDGRISSYSQYVDIFRSLPELTQLSIDSFYNLRIGGEFATLSNLKSLSIQCDNLRSISDDSLKGFQFSNVTHFELASNFKFAVRVGVDVFQFLPKHVSHLEIHFLQVGNRNALRMMKPLVGRHMNKLVFNGTYSSFYSTFDQKLEDGIITTNVSRYLSDICLKEFYWYDSRVTGIESDFGLSPTWQDCLGSFYLETDAIIVDANMVVFFQVMHMKKLLRLTHMITGHKLIKTFWEDGSGIHSEQRGRDNNISSFDVDDRIRVESVHQTSGTSYEQFTVNIQNRNDSALVKKIHQSVGKSGITNDDQNSLSSWLNGDSLALLENHSKPHKTHKIDFPREISTSLGAVYIITPPPALEIFEMDGLTYSSTVVNTISFRQNNILSFGTTYCNWGKGKLSLPWKVLGLNRLETIDFQRCKLDVPKGFFAAFPSLKKLILREALDSSSNTLHTTCKTIVDNVPNLEYLDIAENGIHMLPDKTFHVNKKLKYLCLAFNRLTRLPFDLKLTPKLEILDLRGNSFNYLSAADRAAIQYHTRLVHNFTIFLDNNELSCSCPSFPFVAWLQENLAHFDRNGNYSCISEDGTFSWTGSYQDVEGFWRQCYGFEFFFVSLVLACALIAAYLAIFLGMKNKTQILSKVMQLVTPGFRLKTRQDYVYDVCIGYADQDGLYIRNVLLRYLEGMWHLRTFVHQRDLMQDPLLMSQALRDSWRCLLVITESFLDRYEMAHNVMKVATFFVNPSNPRSVVVMVEENVQHQIPDYVLQVVDDDNIIVLPRLHEFLDYEAKETLKTRIL